MARKKKRGIKLIHIIAIIIIIIIGIIVIVNNTKNNKTEQTKTQTVTQNTSNQAQNNKNEEEKYVQVEEDGTKINTSTKLRENKKLGDLELQNIQLTYKNGVTNLLCNIKNNSKNNSNIKNVNIVLLDEKGNKIYTMQGIIEEIKPGEKAQFNTSITADFANAYNFEIENK